ncbi:MAG TPA: nucleoside triphosphate pyrophosphohydrolase [Xanthobacteraceae bacterium]|nr:nucleoside triphosphate pyrophosphohydrolase [Xanthobacteraceae bacterium]
MKAEASRDIEQLLALMAALRTPGSGCPWDLEQTFETIAPYTLEEAYEVADAIARGDLAGLKDELGDLLLQVVFHARMAEERGAFDFGGVVYAITDKLVRRHPHVFGGGRDIAPEEVKALWQTIKDEERAKAGKANASALDGIPGALPALSRAEKLQTKAARVGFDWPSVNDVKAKIEEEIRELSAAMGDREKAAEEFGDLLFALVNFARHAGVDAEAALRAANRKFERRFHAVEKGLAARGRTPAQSNLAEMDALWDAAKAAERADGLKRK